VLWQPNFDAHRRQDALRIRCGDVHVSSNPVGDQAPAPGTPGLCLVADLWRDDGFAGSREKSAHLHRHRGRQRDGGLALERIGEDALAWITAGIGLLALAVMALPWRPPHASFGQGTRSIPGCRHTSWHLAGRSLTVASMQPTVQGAPVAMPPPCAGSGLHTHLSTAAVGPHRLCAGGLRGGLSVLEPTLGMLPDGPPCAVQAGSAKCSASASSSARSAAVIWWRVA